VALIKTVIVTILACFKFHIRKAAQFPKVNKVNIEKKLDS